MLDEHEIKIPVYHKDIVNAIVRHEVGHFYMAINCDFEVSGIDITINGNGSGIGGATIKIINSQQLEIQCVIINRIKVLMAGVLAEILENTGEIDIEKAVNLFETTAQSDKYKIDEHLHILRCIIYPQVTDDNEINGIVTRFCEKIWGETITFVKDNATLILDSSARISKQIDIASKKYHFDKINVIGT